MLTQLVGSCMLFQTTTIPQIVALIWHSLIDLPELRRTTVSRRLIPWLSLSKRLVLPSRARGDSVWVWRKASSKPSSKMWQALADLLSDSKSGRIKILTTRYIFSSKTFCRKGLSWSFTFTQMICCQIIWMMSLFYGEDMENYKNIVSFYIWHNRQWFCVIKKVVPTEHWIEI